MQIHRLLFLEKKEETKAVSQQRQCPSQREWLQGVEQQAQGTPAGFRSSTWWLGWGSCCHPHFSPSEHKLVSCGAEPARTAPFLPCHWVSGCFSSKVLGVDKTWPTSDCIYSSRSWALSLLSFLTYRKPFFRVAVTEVYCNLYLLTLLAGDSPLQLSLHTVTRSRRQREMGCVVPINRGPWCLRMWMRVAGEGSGGDLACPSWIAQTLLWQDHCSVALKEIKDDKNKLRGVIIIERKY